MGEAGVRFPGLEWVHPDDIKRFLSHGEDWWPPHEIRLELVEGCPLRCYRCGISGIRRPEDEHMNMMPQWLWRKIAEDLRQERWYTRINLTGRGEPGIHPFLEKAIWDIRRRAPRTSIRMETSGVGLCQPNLTNKNPMLISMINELVVLLDAGLNVLVVGRRRGAEKYWDVLDQERGDFYAHLGLKIRRGRPTGGHENMGTNVLQVCLMPDVEDAVYTDNPAWPHGGAGREIRLKRGRCIQPAIEMAVRFDGRVQLCSEDWRGEVCLGDLKTQTLREVYYGDIARAARARAWAGRRDLGPCIACDREPRQYKQYRARWLELRRPPTEEDRRLIENMLRRGPMTRPVLREWEEGVVDV